MGVEIERLSEDRLSREVWRFRVDAQSWSDTVWLHVSYFARESRPSTRHKWRVVSKDRWDTWDTRSYHSGIKAEDVPVPDDVVAEAKSKIEISVNLPRPRP